MWSAIAHTSSIDIQLDPEPEAISFERYGSCATGACRTTHALRDFLPMRPSRNAEVCRRSRVTRKRFFSHRSLSSRGPPPATSAQCEK